MALVVFHRAGQNPDWHHHNALLYQAVCTEAATFLSNRTDEKGRVGLPLQLLILIGIGRAELGQFPGPSYVRFGSKTDVSGPLRRRQAETASANGGQGGIRTHDTLAGMPHFECGAIDHSTTCPPAVIREVGLQGKVFSAP